MPPALPDSLAGLLSLLRLRVHGAELRQVLLARARLQRPHRRAHDHRRLAGGAAGRRAPPLPGPRLLCPPALVGRPARAGPGRVRGGPLARARRSDPGGDRRHPVRPLRAQGVRRRLALRLGRVGAGEAATWVWQLVRLPGAAGFAPRAHGLSAAVGSPLAVRGRSGAADPGRPGPRADRAALGALRRAPDRALRRLLLRQPQAPRAPGQVTACVRLRSNAAFWEQAPREGRRPGRPRKRGRRLGSLRELAAPPGPPVALAPRRAGERRTIEFVSFDCSWYRVLGERPVGVVIPTPRRSPCCSPTAASSRPRSSPSTPTAGRSRCLRRGQGAARGREARNRVEPAVERTVPFGFPCRDLVVIWYAHNGDAEADVGRRLLIAPWYRQKRTPAFADMLTALRRELIRAEFRHGLARQRRRQKLGGSSQQWSAGGLGPETRSWPPSASAAVTSTWLRSDENVL
jgi:hypothetical protein